MCVVLSKYHCWPQCTFIVGSLSSGEKVKQGVGVLYLALSQSCLALPSFPDLATWVPCSGIAQSLIVVQFRSCGWLPSCNLEAITPKF